jgi:hypothetical protein
MVLNLLQEKSVFMFPCQSTSLISKTEMIHIIVIDLLKWLNQMVTVTAQTIPVLNKCYKLKWIP